LTAHDFLRVERPHRAEQAQLLRLHRLGFVTGGRIHRQQCDDLQQVILHYIANGADFFVEGAAALHAEFLGHGDLHVLDIVAIPNGLEKGVGEAEIQKILYRLLA